MTDDHSERLQPHLSDVTPDRDLLRQLLVDYREALEQDAVDNEFLDLKMATTLIEKFNVLLTEVNDDEEMKLVAGGVRYLLDNNDEIPDYEIAGFDDDAEVFNYVAKQCDRPDLTIEI